MEEACKSWAKYLREYEAAKKSNIPSWGHSSPPERVTAGELTVLSLQAQMNPGKPHSRPQTSVLGPVGAAIYRKNFSLACLEALCASACRRGFGSVHSTTPGSF